MLVLEIVLAVPLLAVLLLLAVAVRRRGLQAAGGTVELSLRLTRRGPGRGWVHGVGRFVDDDLRWYRVFSLSPRPRLVLSRRTLEVVRRRLPSAVEHRALPDGAVVMECRADQGPVELAMQPSTVTGFLAWLESRPPGATLPVWTPRRPA